MVERVNVQNLPLGNDMKLHFLKKYFIGHSNKIVSPFIRKSKAYWRAVHYSLFIATSTCHKWLSV